MQPRIGTTHLAPHLLASLFFFEAIHWAFTLCAYGPDESAAAYEDFFKHRVRRSSGEAHIGETVALYDAASWRVALDMRGGKSFDNAVDEFIHDTAWHTDQIERFRDRLAQRRGGKGDGRHRRSRSRTGRYLARSPQSRRSRSPSRGRRGKPQGKNRSRERSPLRRQTATDSSKEKKLLKTDKLGTADWNKKDEDGNELCRNFSLGICRKTSEKCQWVHKCAICLRKNCKAIACDRR